jgi:hypothetical protein
MQIEYRMGNRAEKEHWPERAMCQVLDVQPMEDVQQARLETSMETNTMDSRWSSLWHGPRVPHNVNP